MKRLAQVQYAALRHAEQCVDALADTELSLKQKLTLLAKVDDDVFGHALREVEAATPIDEALAGELLATGEFPPPREDVFSRAHSA